MQVVLIDNNEQDIYLYRIILTRAGFEFKGFLFAEDFFAWIEENKPDAILIDLAMIPAGTKVAKRLQEMNIPARVGFLTGEIIDEVIEDAARTYNVERCFRKDFDLQRFIEELRGWIENQ